MGVQFMWLHPAVDAAVRRKQVEEGGAARIVEGRCALTASAAIAAAAAESWRLLNDAPRRGVDPRDRVNDAIVVAAVGNVGAEARQPRMQQQHLCPAIASCCCGRRSGIRRIQI